ncbi:MAG: DUF2764 family protein [Candidatus Auribacterota bacterium]|nr:DUF2764 family protein [Candidatus Auribacterota bacterium]
MSRNYYYFAATLPMLTFGTRPPMSSEDFLEKCDEYLSRGDREVISNALLMPPDTITKKNTVLNRWIAFENASRNELVNFRAKKLGRDPGEYFRGEYVPNPYIAALVVSAAQADNPLLVERRIDLARWEKLDEIELQHYFDLQFLIVYYLKLQILNKWDSIRAEKGRAVLDELLKPEEIKR